MSGLKDLKNLNSNLKKLEPFNKQKYLKLRKIYTDIVKKIDNYKTRELPSSQTKKITRIDPYKAELIDSYNTVASYVGKYHAKFEKLQTELYSKDIGSLKSKINKSLNVLDLKVANPINSETIDIQKVVDVNDSPQIFAKSSKLARSPPSVRASILQKQTSDSSATVVASNTVHTPAQTSGASTKRKNRRKLSHQM